VAWEFLKTLVKSSSIDLPVPGNSTAPTRKSMMTAEKYAKSVIFQALPAAALFTTPLLYPTTKP
jgi:hypothetical protein